MVEPITDEQQITPRWLTQRLRQGHLVKGKISELTFTSFKTFFSNIYQLKVTYSIDAVPTLPQKLLLKVPFSEMESALNMGRDEVKIYDALEKAMDDPPIVCCFDSVYSPHTNRSHLLLEDLSDSHYQPELPLPPSERNCELCVETLAQFHAFWWEHPQLGSEIGQLLDEESLKEIVERIRDALSAFIDFLGVSLSPNRRRAYEKAMEFVPEFWNKRLTSVKQNTLIHGDAHLWNFLHPKDIERGRAYLIDLATCNRVRPPTNDLAYMMALQWFPERRAIMEERLLQHYHSALLSNGVKNYTWEDCRLDYRYSVITHLFTPVSQWHSKLIPATVWWYNFERITEAYKDLKCDELL